MGGTDDMPDTGRARRSPRRPLPLVDAAAAPAAWVAPPGVDLARRGLALARDLLTGLVTGAVRALDGHEGARRNAVRAITADVARARERAEASRALGAVPSGQHPAA
ncbi:MAG: hypothetical protein ACTHQ3_10570 [Motilibacteraceae bacterium]